MDKKSAALTAILTGLLLLPSGLLSQERDPDAGKVQEAIDELLRSSLHNEGAGKVYVFSEDELNAYIAERIRTESPKGLKKMQVRLKENGMVESLADVDLDEVDMSEVPAAGLVRAFLKGRRTIGIHGTVEGRQGMANIRVTDVYLGSLRLPSALAQSVLKQAGEKLQPPRDLAQPTPLPYGIRSIEIREGKAIVRN